jgi:S1-C subfamily serine protease
VPQLIKGGKYIRPALGIEVDEGLNQRLAQVRGVSGVVILRVTPGSAAEAAGLKGATLSRDGGIVPGDTIVEIAGKKVDSVGKLLSSLDDHKIGDVVKVTVLRDGKKQVVDVTLQPGA